MKLVNKKTGEIKDFALVVANGSVDDTTLAELNEECEDYEEAKEYWYVSCDGRVLKATMDEDDYNEKHISGHKEIGNYFETREEAEKAVEKLKAWKRLKDKGFRFNGWDGTRIGTHISYISEFYYEDAQTIWTCFSEVKNEQLFK